MVNRAFMQGENIVTKSHIEKDVVEKIRSSLMQQKQKKILNDVGKLKVNK